MRVTSNKLRGEWRELEEEALVGSGVGRGSMGQAVAWVGVRARTAKNNDHEQTLGTGTANATLEY